MQHQVYKDPHTKSTKIGAILQQAPAGSKILIVFWHGLGDTLMFLPLFDYVRQQFPQLVFELALLPGVDQENFLTTYHRKRWPAIAIPEDQFLTSHDAAFVISFPMNEGLNNMTKAEYCCQIEFGLPPMYFGLPPLHTPVKRNNLVGLHLQGTCLPGSTNPDEELAHRIWDAVLAAGYIPIDLHFKHAFHNPQNADFPWATRSCRDLPPSIGTLQLMMERCMAVIAVASGPFVLAASIMPHRTIYLQKHHPIECYLQNFQNVILLDKYAAEGDEGDRERQRLTHMLWAIDEL